MSKRKKTPPSSAYLADPVERVVAFLSLLRHSKGEWAGQPFVLEPWQLDIVRAVFGRRDESGRRITRTLFVEIPRKNGKSTLGAALALFLLLADGEPGAEIYSAAADKDQAKIIFRQAKEFVLGSPAIAKRCKVYKEAIEVQATSSFYRVISSTPETKHGLNAHGLLFDELHALPDRDLWDVLTTSTGARRQPLTLAFTTAGYDRHSICYEIHDTAIKVRDGVIDDPSFFPAVFAAGEEEDWKDIETYKRANPNFGVSVKEEYLQQKIAEAIATPANENKTRRLHLNQWTEQATRALSLEQWDKGATPAIDRASLKGRPCFAALDLGSTGDLTALALFFEPETLTEPIDVLLYYWVPSENVRARVKKDRVPYDRWIKDGWIRTTEGNVTDYAVIRRDINQLGAIYQIRELAIDRLFQGAQTATELGQDGFDVVAFGQGFFSMAAPTRRLLELVAEGKIHHGGNPVLRWNAANLAVETDPAGNLKPSKKTSIEKIDGMVAVIMALGRWMAKLPGPEPQYLVTL